MKPCGVGIATLFMTSSVMNGLLIFLEDGAMVQCLVVNLFMLVLALQNLLFVDLLADIPDLFLVTCVKWLLVKRLKSITRDPESDRFIF